MMLNRLFDWLQLRDLDDAVRSARLAVMRRVARGNVTFQNGDILDDEALDELRDDGNRAANVLIAKHAFAGEHHGKHS